MERRVRHESAMASWWAVSGVAGLFAWGAYRLGARGLETLRSGLGAFEWTAAIVLIVAFVYGEGLVALDRRWVPKLFERARRLRDEHRLLPRLLAPLYGLSLLGSDRTEVVRGWAGTLAIVAAVFVVRALPDPWRGIVDFAVAAALAWGLSAIVRRLPAVAW
jgi:hypothetical protein